MATEYGSGGNLSVQMDGPFAGSGAASGGGAKIVNISAPVANWKGGESPFSQVVELNSVSVRSQVNLQLSKEQIEKISVSGFALTAENTDGEVTVYAIGNKPTESYTIQATVMEVIA
jgi:hypothetical protein